MNPEERHESVDFSMEDSKPLMAREDGHEEEVAGLQKTSTRRRKNRQIYSAVLLFRHGLNTVLLLAILAFLITTKSSNTRWQLQTSGDVTGFAPKIGHQIKKFAHDPSFTPDDPAEFFSNRIRQNWLDLVPKGLGYIRINNPEEYDNLPTPLPEYDSPVFTTSVTHQLHCLYRLQELFSSLMSNNTGGQVPDSAGWHSGHCFEYLRQSILCCGDTALEGKQTSFPENTPGSDGWDAKHICRDYSQIREYLEENRVDDKVWI